MHSGEEGNNKLFSDQLGDEIVCSENIGNNLFLNKTVDA